MAKSQIISEIPDAIDANEHWLVEYWAKAFSVTAGRLKQCIALVGPHAKRIRSLLTDGHRIALEDKDGTCRLVGRITRLPSGGFSVQCPYHPEKSGWVFKAPVTYDIGESFKPIDNAEQFSVSDTVKLSLHMNGFVQFSSATGKKIVSGFCQDLQKPKGVGLKAPHQIEVTTGPLCGFSVQGLDRFRKLATETAEVFLREDLWYHPEYPADSDAYHVEMFMLPLWCANAAESVNGRRVLKKFLPFYAKFKFPHTLRVIEIPGDWYCLGIIVGPQPMDSTVTSGYKLNSPSVGEPGREKFAISAWYPRPSILKDHPSQSLDYVPSEPEHASPGEPLHIPPR
jgi:hypothetical protein